MKELLIQAKKDGFRHYKIKVGGDIDRDLRRMKIFREVNGWDDVLMLDSNQVRSCMDLDYGVSDIPRSGPCPKLSHTWRN